jgi:deoxycytidine triphosphate deaminase
MILTGREIQREWSSGRITIDPFTPDQVNPNSYNFRLGSKLRVYREAVLDPRKPNESEEIDIPADGFVLEAGRLYLAHTIEVLGSDLYAPTFAARSSIARLGIFINLSASLGDIGFKGQWTLQLYTVNRVRVYAGMNIGQMMWWVPQGSIELYEGKYQSSQGPRSSDIHIDFEKQTARQRFPGLAGTVESREVGPKFAAIASASHDFRVPAAFSLPVGEFLGSLTHAQSDGLADAFADLKATVGAFYAESVARIAAIGAAVKVPEDTRRLLRLRLADVFGDLSSTALAVRSSGLDEDGERSSLAGLYQSVLNVRGLDQLITAIERCWTSYYQAPAVAARVRSGDHQWSPRLAVFVQRMVDAEIAGVAFSGLAREHPDRVVVEYVDGLGDALMAGLATPTRVSADADEEGELDPRLSPVVEMVRALRARRGHDVDVEWAVDRQGVHLLQVRPLTAWLDPSAHETAPSARAYSLYFDELPSGAFLDSAARVYGEYVAKRRGAYRLARSEGIPVAKGWVFQFNGRGIHSAEHRALLERELASGHARECVLDLGDHLRQIIVPKGEAVPKLIELTGARVSGTEMRAAVVRDFVRGSLGVISRVAEGGGLVVEYAEQGLMALNRGTAGAVTLAVPNAQNLGPVMAEDAAAPVREHLATIARLTAALNAKLGPVTLEWVKDGDEVYFVDYTKLNGGDGAVSPEGTVLVSPGVAQGPLLRLDRDELLGRLSIGPAVSVSKSRDVAEYGELSLLLDRLRAMPRPPVIHCSRPFAVLSVLIGHVAGFVFDEGSTLGHLAILLREAGVPAVTAAGFEGDGEVMISNGTISVMAEES